MKRRRRRLTVPMFFFWLALTSTAAATIWYGYFFGTYPYGGTTGGSAIGKG